MPDKHSHVMGGSTAPRRINCPGSLEAEKAAPEPPESEFAKRGSMLHAAMELLVTADPDGEVALEDALGELLGQDLGFGEDFIITQELIDTKLRPAMLCWFDVLDEYVIDDWFIEQQVSLETVIPGAFGTADIIAKDAERRLHVLDWKFGDGVTVAVEGSMALGFYTAASMYDEAPELVAFCEDITGVVMHIVQPRVGADIILHSWETTEEWIEQFVDQAAVAMDLAIKPNAPLKVGDWCKFCKATVTCEALNAMAATALSATPKSMTAVELGNALTMATQLKSWVAEVFKLAQAELEGGAAVPGFKLVQKRPSRAWTADVEFIEGLLKKKKARIADTHTRKLKSPAQLEKVNKKLYKNTLAEYVAMISTGLTLVPDSDKRPAVSDSVQLLATAMDTAKIEKK